MFMLTTADGCTLKGRVEGLDPARSVRGLVLIVHGLGEHAGRYDAVARELCAEGWAVARYDQRGHGLSGGARGALAADDSYLSDLGQVLGHLQDRLSRRASGAGPGPARGDAGPLVLLGHSMGGLVAARFVAEGLAAQPATWWRPVAALALSSPALDVGMRPWQRALTGWLAPRWPGLALGNGLNPAWVSRDAAVVQAYRTDALVHNRITPRLARFFLEAGALVLARAADWRVPTHLMVAGADRCVRPEGSAAFAARVPPAVLSQETFPSLYHEIFNEPERAQVLAGLMQWLSHQAGVLPASPAPSSSLPP